VKFFFQQNATFQNRFPSSTYTYDHFNGPFPGTPGLASWLFYFLLKLGSI